MFYLATAQRGLDPAWNRWADTIAYASTTYGVPIPLIMGVIAKESSWNPNAVNLTGSSAGLMQIEFRQWGVSRENALVPEWAITFGAQILGEQLARRGGREDLAVAGYNAGVNRSDAELASWIASNHNNVGSHVADVLAYRNWYAINGAPGGGAPGDPFRRSVVDDANVAPWDQSGGAGLPGPARPGDSDRLARLDAPAPDRGSGGGGRNLPGLAGLIALALTFSGCLSMPANPERMSPEQIREWTKDKSIAATCATVNTPYGRGVVVHVGMDKGVVTRGSVTVDDQCKVTINNEPLAPR